MELLSARISPVPNVDGLYTSPNSITVFYTEKIS